jgi:hypothetical protein
MFILLLFFSRVKKLRVPQVENYWVIKVMCDGHEEDRAYRVGTEAVTTQTARQVFITAASTWIIHL